MAGVLLLVDQKARDLLSVLLVGEYLREFGVPVHYCNKHDMLPSAERFHPEIFVMSCTEGQYRDLALHLSPDTKLVLMTQEGACATKEATVMRHTLEGFNLECYTRGLSRVYLWGDLSRKWLLEDKVYPAEIMSSVGTSRLDIYRTTPDSQPKCPFTVGFAGRGAGINPAGDANLIKTLDSVRKLVGSHRAYVSPGREWEDYLWHSMASMRVNLDLIERLCDSPGVQVEFRPDPYENHSSYDFLAAKYPNLKINTDPVLFNFLSGIDVLITEFSTTGIEALLLDKPVISTQKLLGPRLAEHNSLNYHVNPAHMHLYWQPDTEVALISLVESAKHGKLQPSPEMNEAHKYLRDYYDWDSAHSKSVALKIATDLKDLLKQPLSDELLLVRRADHRAHPMLTRIKRRVFGNPRLARWALKQVWLFDFWACLGFWKAGTLRSSLRAEFFGWNRTDRLRAEKVFRKLRAADDRAATKAIGSTKPSRDSHAALDC